MIEREREQKSGLFINGELQIGIAIDALREHALGSRALTMLVTIQTVSDMLKRAHGAEGMLQTGPTAFVEDDEMKHDLIAALKKRLENDELDEFERAGIQELLDIQESR